LVLIEHWINRNHTALIGEQLTKLGQQVSASAIIQVMQNPNEYDSCWSEFQIDFAKLSNIAAKKSTVVAKSLPCDANVSFI
jgi:hypothetical protein